MTQILGGMAADRFGGARVLLIGLGLWSLAVCLIPTSTLPGTPFPPFAVIMAARILFGMASGCAVPACASAVATYVTPERRAGSLTFLFAFFNCGSAFGLLLAGGLITHLGWQSVFLAFGGVGVLWSVSGYLALPAAAKQMRLQRNPAAVAGKVTSVDERVNTVATKAEAEAGVGDGVEVGRAPATDKGWDQLPGWMYPQLLSLAWCHICINWGFFIMQSWLPIYLAKSLGLSLGSSGLMSALPWFLTAAMALSSGQVADGLLARGWRRWEVRRLMMNIATVGPAAALALLALPLASSTAAALALLAAMLGTQAVAVSGYHSYLQDVAPSRAGAFLGLTNTLGVGAGIAANLLTGYILETTGSFELVFVVTAGMYASGGVVWNTFLRGRMLFP